MRDITILKKKCGIFCLFFLFFFMLCNNSMAEKISLKYGYDPTPEMPSGKAIAKFAELVKEKTNGRIEIKLYGSGTLGSSKEVIEGFLTGGIDIINSSDGNLADYTHGVDILGLPYMFDGMDELKKFWYSDLRHELLRKVEEDIECKLLMSLVSGGGPRHIVHLGKKIVRVPDDLKGMKIRTTGASTEVAVLKAWGARPTPVAWAEVYTSLQQGIVDGTYNQYIWTYLPRFHEVCKGITELSANWVFGLQFISLKVWNKLSKEDQEIILEAAGEANKYGDKLAVGAAQEAKENLIKAGVKIYVPTDEEALIWKEKARGTWDQFVGTNKTINPSAVQKLTKFLEE